MKKVNIKILYDNQALAGFRSGWGFSVLINGTVLFDLGEKAASLKHNMDAFGVNYGRIRNVVLSHEDWDHVGGLSVIKQCCRIKFYTPTGVSEKFKKRVGRLTKTASLIEVADDMEIAPDVFVTKTLKGMGKKEISLFVRTESGLVLITGCAHPGLSRIMNHVRRHGDICAVVGGFHGFSRLGELAEIPVIIPCHCTKKREAILRKFPETAHPVAAGFDLQIGG